MDPAATQIVGRAVDGFTVGFPTGYAIADDREPLVAVAMNGEPLPVDHGFPARLIVPGLYGYVSATKWLTEIELTTLDAFDALLGPARLGEGGADPDPVADRRAAAGAQRRARGRFRLPASRGRPDRGSPRWSIRDRWRRWEPAEISTPISDATWVQFAHPGTRGRRAHPRGPAPPTATARSRPTR